jgi:hypothetical protein
VTRGPNWTSQQQQCMTSWSGTQYDGRAVSFIIPTITIQWCRVTREQKWTSQQQQHVTSWYRAEYDGWALSSISIAIIS